MSPEELARLLLETLDEGVVQRLYRAASVPPDSVLADFAARGEPVRNFSELQKIPTERIDPLATRYVRSARLHSAILGAGVGSAGWIGLPSGLAHVAVVLVRLAQRVSLAYGFDYRSDRGEIELWKALALALDAKVDWEGTEAELLRKLPVVVTGTGTFANPLLLKAIQSVVLQIARTAGLRSARWVPVVGGGTALVLNWLHVDRVGRRLQAFYRQRHMLTAFDTSRAVLAEVVG
jgi:hypothetical protein